MGWEKFESKFFLNDEAKKKLLKAQKYKIAELTLFCDSHYLVPGESRTVLKTSKKILKIPFEYL